jgi:polysaccharide transporter, PST family
LKIYKTAYYSVFAALTKAVSGLLLIKVVALQAGPHGIALIGQLQSFVSIVQTLSTGGTGTGVVKYTSEYQKEPSRQAQIWIAAISITISVTALIVLVLLYSANFFSEIILQDIRFGLVFKLFAAALIFFSLNQIVISILNGLGEIRAYALINIVQSLTMVMAVLGGLFFWGLVGAFAGIVTGQSFVFVVSLCLLARKSLFSRLKGRYNVNKDAFTVLLRYSIMAFVSILMYPVAQIVIRNYIGDQLSWDEVGFCEAIWRISGVYLFFITFPLSVYVIPKLSSTFGENPIKKELSTIFKLVVPVAIVGAAVIYFGRSVIIVNLFTEKFTPAIDLIGWQVVGDVFRVVSYVFIYFLLSKSKVKLYIFTEMAFTTLYVALSILLLSTLGLKGVVLAHFLNYVASTIFLAFAVYIKILKRENIV